MAGNSNSGRRGGLTTQESALRLSTISKAWKLLSDNLDDETLDKKVRLDIAAKLAVKSIPTELTGDLGVSLTAMGTITKSGPGTLGATTMEFNIGSKPDVSDPPEDP